MIRGFVRVGFPYRSNHVGGWDHYCDAIMVAMAFQITSLMVVYSTVHAGADQRKHQSSASLVFVWWIPRWPVNSSHKGPVTRKMFPFHYVIMSWNILLWCQQVLSPTADGMFLWLLCGYYTMRSCRRNVLRITDSLLGESTGNWWPPLTQAHWYRTLICSM